MTPQQFIISFFVSIYLIFIQSPLLAQDTIPSDTLSVPVDSALYINIETDLTLPGELPEETVTAKIQEPITPPKLISGIEASVDLLKFSGLFLDFETKYEGSLGIIFKNRYMISLEAGEGNLEPKRAYKNASYQSDGRYARIGLHYMVSLDEKNFMIIGAKYGQSRFTEIIDYEIENIFGENLEEKIIRPDLNGQWFEFTFATETNIFDNFYSGAIFRFRLLWKNKEVEPFEVYGIPGYGRAFDNTIPALNIYLKYRFNF